MNKLLTSHEQVPTVVIMRLETDKTTIPGCVWWGWFPTAVRIRLSQPPAWLAGAWAELGKNIMCCRQERSIMIYCERTNQKNEKNN